MNTRSVSGLAFVAGIAFVGCAHSADAPSTTASSEAPTAAPADDEASASLADHHRHHPHSGVTSFIALSLDTLGTDTSKKVQIEKIQADLEARMAASRDAEKDFMTALADGVAAGILDSTRVTKGVQELRSAAGNLDASTADSLNELHALLSPIERAALVDKVRAHWQVWRQVNHEESLGSQEHGSRLSNLAAELALTPAQVSQISSNLSTAMAGMSWKYDPNETETHIGGFSTAFVADSFDARSVKTGENANNHVAAYGAERMVAFYQSVTPVLTPEQRQMLSESIREHLTHQQTHAAN